MNAGRPGNGGNSRPEQSATLAARARRMARAGHADEAAALYRRCLDLEPEHMAALTFLGMHAFEQGALEHAERYQRKAIELMPGSAVLHQNLGIVRQAMGQLESALSSFDEAVRLDPDAAQVRLHRAGVRYALGRHEAAVSDCCRAGRLDEAMCRAHQRPDAPPMLKRIARHAQKIVWEYVVERERGAVEPLRGANPPEALTRVDGFLRVQHHDQPPEFPDPLQRPSVYFFPGLVPCAFAERGAFPWLKHLEAGADRIRDELRRLLEKRATSLTPYVPETGQPTPEGWDRLAGSMDWSAFHLLKGGRRVEDNAAECPATVALLEQMPLCTVQGHAPEAFFSFLKPGAHIPPHFGISNFKLTLHLPLVVPEGCSIRVGNETRQWREGECLIFDDSFEHEAWNRGDRTRIVLITDIWNPHMTGTEREAVQAVVKASDDFIRWCQAGGPGTG